MLAKGSGLPSIHPRSFVDMRAERRKARAADVGTGSSLEIRVPPGTAEPPTGRSGAPWGIVPAAGPARAAGSHSRATMEARQAPQGTKPNLRDTGAEKALPKKGAVKSSWMPCVRGYPIRPPAVPLPAGGFVPPAPLNVTLVPNTAGEQCGGNAGKSLLCPSRSESKYQMPAVKGREGNGESRDKKEKAGVERYLGETGSWL